MTGTGDELEDNWEDLVNLAQVASERARQRIDAAPAMPAPEPMPEPLPRLVGEMDAGLLAKMRKYGDPVMTAHLGTRRDRVHLCGRCLRLETEMRRHHPGWVPNPAQSWIAASGIRVWSARCGPCASLERAEQRARKSRIGRMGA